MRSDAPTRGFRRVVVGCGVAATAGLLGYAAAYLIVLPTVGSSGFVPTSLGDVGGRVSGFAATLAACASLYALAVLPVALVYAVKGYQRSPYGMTLAASLIGVSSILEIINNLPVIALAVYPHRLQAVPADVVLRLAQEDAIAYLALDVLGFALIYAGFLVFGLADRHVRRWPAVLTAASIALFAANVPFLWLAPQVAVCLMAASILALACIPVLLAVVATRSVREAASQDRSERAGSVR
jgi:hypothetical protein